MNWLLWLVVCLLVVVIVTLIIRVRKLTKNSEGLTKKAEDLTKDNEILAKKAEDFAQKAHDLVIQAENTAQVNLVTQAEREQLDSLQEQLEDKRLRLATREEKAEQTAQQLREESSRLHTEWIEIRKEHNEVDKLKDHLQVQLQEAEYKLTTIAGLTQEEAIAQVIERAESKARTKAIRRAAQVEAQIRESAKQKAAEILVTAMQRIATEQTAESVITSIDLPNEEMKGRIIGREGRNIRAFEQTTGVNVLIDDTPGMVLLSCFDPVRREAARLTMSELISDGRIYPARIEEVHARSVDELAQDCIRLGRQTAAQLGIDDLAEQLLKLVGSLQYRTSYGQNVLSHLVEAARLAAAIAAELGLNVDSCRRAAFLHDIGKAVITDGHGSHALEGAEIARKNGESAEVVNAIASHHNEIEPNCVEAIITQVADATSGSRPGARRESIEAYVQRLERIEQIGLSHQGVDRVYAMQAGHEVRVMVLPEDVPEAQTQFLAEQIAQEIQDELTYPGNVKVTVVRESRATAMAH